MKKFRGSATLAIAALLCAQAAQANDTIYLGDCARAEQVKAQSTIDVLLPHPRYEGVGRIHSGWLVNSQCNQDQIIVYTLKQTYRSSTELAYEVARQSINFGKTVGCMTPKSSGGIVGTVQFESRIKTVGELCEVYIWADWTLRDNDQPDWKSDFATRALAVSGGSFILTQLASDGTSYWTPLAFTGVGR